MNVTNAQDDPIVVVCSSDDSYSLPLGVALFSMIDHLDKDARVDIYILSLGISASSKQRLTRILANAPSSVKHTIVDIDDTLVESLGIRSNYVTPATYLRLFIPSILPDKYDKAIYIDCDVLVRKNIRELWNCDLGGNILLAACSLGMHKASDPGHVHNWKELGIPVDNYYFNAGILVMNLKLWRERNLTEELLKYAVDNKDALNYEDQGTLNGVCFDSWGQLDPTWNMTANNFTNPQEWPESPFREYVIEHWDDLWRNPSIYHFTTHWKPWTPGHTPYLQNEWFDSLKRSGWFSRSEYMRWMLKWTWIHYARGTMRKLLGVQVTNRRILSTPIRL